MRTPQIQNGLLCLAFVALVSQPGSAQARVSSAPAEPSLLNLAGQWSRASILGDLRELKTRSDHLELRMWDGFGLTTTTQAVVIRREAGHWSAFLARVIRCEIEIPRSVGDTASRPTMQRYVADARRQCGVSIKEVRAGAQLLTTDSLIVERIDGSDSTIEGAWSAALRAGALDLPPRVDRNRTTEDGLSFLLEVRRGNDYRASEIEHVERPDNDADRKIREVYAVVNALLRPDQRPKP